MPLQGKRLAFIGGGTMAEAMIRGLLDKHLVPPSHVLVTGPRRERRAELTKQFGVKALASNVEAAHAAHIVVLSVKPQILPTVLRELRGKLRADQLVVSIIAGAPLAVLREGLDHATIVRAMPNTPAQIGMGITAWCATAPKRSSEPSARRSRSRRRAWSTWPPPSPAPGRHTFSS